MNREVIWLLRGFLILPAAFGLLMAIAPGHVVSMFRKIAKCPRDRSVFLGNSLGLMAVLLLGLSFLLEKVEL